MEELKFAVIGDPIAHSISPQMHEYWYEENDIIATYERRKMPRVSLLSFLNSLEKNNYKGLNVTLPLKEEAYFVIKELGQVCPISEKIKAVNTVSIRDGVLYGSNTDVKGFYDAFCHRIPGDFDVNNKKYLVIGAGGAARAIVGALVENNHQNIIIANRTIERSQKLKEELCPTAQVIPLNQVNEALRSVDVLINTASIGILTGKTLDLNFEMNKKLVCFDAIYKPYTTDLLRDARKNGHHIIRGLSMLMYQGALSYLEWFGEIPEISPRLEDSLRVIL